MFLTLREGGVLDGVTGHLFPFDRLIESVAEQLVNLPYRPRGDKAVLSHSIRAGFCFDRFELLVEVIHKVAFSQSYPAHPGAAAKQLTTMGMCLMNEYEVFKVQSNPPHKGDRAKDFPLPFT